MFYSLIIGGLIGCGFFVVLIYTSWQPLIGSLLYLIYEVLYHYPTFWSLINALFVFIFLFISSRLLYHPYGNPVSIWSAMYMRDDEWIRILNYNIINTIYYSIKSIFKSNHNNNNKNNSISDNKYINIYQHINCIMCYVAHLPSKQQLTQIIKSIINNYPQLRNIPIIGDDMTQSSFQTDYSVYNDVDSHLHEYRLNKKQIEDLDEIMSNKIRMDLTKPWWDIFLITPDVENDERALDPQHAMLCVVVFRFHQSIIDLPTIKQFLYNISSEFHKRNNFMSDDEDDDDIDVYEHKRNQSSLNLFGSPSKYPSQFLLRDNNNPDIDATDATDVTDQSQSPSPDKLDQASSTLFEKRLIYIRLLFSSLMLYVSSFIYILRIYIISGNIFKCNSGYSTIQVITERFEDTSLIKIKQEAQCTLSSIGRACVSGALIRYFSDLNILDINNLCNSRILESYNLTSNITTSSSSICDNSLTSYKLLIGDEYPSSRSRLMSIANANVKDISKTYRRAFWIHILFKFLCIFLPDLLSKKFISLFIQNHTMEICYFQYFNNFILGNEPVEDLRVFKTNLNIPCLCISSYNEHISLDLTFTNISIKYPNELIKGFLAEIEELEAMFSR